MGCAGRLRYLGPLELLVQQAWHWWQSASLAFHGVPQFPVDVDCSPPSDGRAVNIYISPGVTAGRGQNSRSGGRTAALTDPRDA